MQRTKTYKLLFVNKKSRENANQNKETKKLSVIFLSNDLMQDNVRHIDRRKETDSKSFCFSLYPSTNVQFVSFPFQLIKIEIIYIV